jgi:tetratricopeptide (TPR) repeat protein
MKLTGAFISLLFAAPLTALDPVAENALIAGKWRALMERLESRSVATSPPYIRMLLGHACLGVNHNDESLSWFLTTDSPEELKEWQNWTTSLVDRHPGVAIAHYLLGDAFMRAGDSLRAEAAFSKSLALDPGLAVSWSARGVMWAMQGNFDRALQDFTAAIHLAPSLADAHANLGTLWVLRESPTGAIESFNKAIELSSSFALAWNGRGSARFGLRNQPRESAITDFNRAIELMPMLVPALSNRGLMLAMAADAEPPTTEHAGSGTTLMTQSELERINYVDFKSADEMTRFHASVNALPAAEASRVLIVQRARVLARVSQLDDLMGRMRKAAVAAGSIDRDTRLLGSAIDLTAKAMKRPGGVRPEATTKAIARGIELATGGVRAASAPESRQGEAAALIQKALNGTFGGMQAMLDIVNMPARAAGHVAGTELMKAGGERDVRVRQHYLLDRELQMQLARGIAEKADFRSIDLLGRFRTPIDNRGPLVHERIAASAPITEYSSFSTRVAGGMEGSRAGRPAVVVIAGETDPYRQGALLRSLQSRGITTLPVPTGADPRIWATNLGADRLIEIQKESRSATAVRTPIPLMQPAPGGISLNMEHVSVDRGAWPVATFFGLAYQPVLRRGDEIPVNARRAAEPR